MEATLLPERARWDANIADDQAHVMWEDGRRYRDKQGIMSANITSTTMTRWSTVARNISTRLGARVEHMMMLAPPAMHEA
jgi:hypothetical protein